MEMMAETLEGESRSGKSQLLHGRPLINCAPPTKECQDLRRLVHLPLVMLLSSNDSQRW